MFLGVVTRHLGLVCGKTGFPDSERANFGRLRSFRTILHFELDFLTFVQAAITAALNRREMCEYVSTAAVRSDESITLVGVEPLDLCPL